MKKLILTTILTIFAGVTMAQSSLEFTFTRSSGNNANVIVNDGANVTATITATSASNAWNTGGDMASRTGVLCQNTNTNATSEGSPITFTLNISGLDNTTFNKAEFTHIAVNSAGNLQPSNNEDIRHCNFQLEVNGETVGTLSNQNIWIPHGETEKTLTFNNLEVNATDGSITLKLTLYKGTNNNGCFYGLTKIKLSSGNESPTPTPSPSPVPKVYLISWKNTGANYITEEPDGRMTVQGKDVTKQQFWMFIPTENENCFYIKNTATGKYMGSCNLPQSDESKVQTSTSPVEYYVAKTAATSGENANCWYFSSTDCDNYSNESSNPRALNKDGASNYVITWNAGTDKVGSYWTLIETEDLYELRPFAVSSAIGNIGASYNMETPDGKNLTISEGNLAIADPDSFDENQEWYFVGTNDGTGCQIASASEPATVIGFNEENIIAAENLTTKWKVKKGEVNGYYYFISNNTTLKVENDSLFRFTRVRSAYSRTLKVYNNPCGAVGNNYIKKAEVHGDGALDNIIYESNSKPGKWHIMYALDKGEVVKGNSFDIDVTLAENVTNGLTAIAHFDWNSDGIFETAEPLTLNGTTGNAEITVPEWATATQTRMRIRINSNGLDLAEDDVYGFIYDFHIKVVEAKENRTVSVSVNADDRGNVTLSDVAENYQYGATLTAKATPNGYAQFVCWREEGVVVSTDPEYTFTVDHNVKLVAYFTPNAQGTTDVKNVVADEEIVFTLQNNTITAVANCDVTGMTLYTIDAAVVAKSNGNTIDTTGIGGGVYIVCAKTENGYKNCKIYLNK